ncbi:hypothetical protein GCM10009555_034780 [Acrocarpospora macrocephala]|uniref:Uncharacterized protein n=1 Tax=Acrocarpospora macrocephala TaxID=150177 RepID=A0A5M3WEB1_9ACTN|nr:hypothetical protein [Acrocarpospora macrocephala]GES06659.1 hypothetical protein Amac_002540 [Acrocarpospora macrocephala]
MIYPWIWGKLPGGRYVKTVCAVLLVAAAGSLLWYVVFPLVDLLLGLDEVTVEPSAGQP